ncbi:superoxide dismutase [Paracoccus tibetensis]|uniref:superoxide dismutase n=1 Tax=Paracoccus tibetensis TaxID=336292 RepID=A0A1G5HGP8_9RHOB|nr:superoxide dismutase [Paracoccus tibetensis]SCY62208.1 superoxide dismutase, Fe-Mn family [Paracoccus tibetensis]
MLERLALATAVAAFPLMAYAQTAETETPPDAEAAVETPVEETPAADAAATEATTDDVATDDEATEDEAAPADGSDEAAAEGEPAAEAAAEDADAGAFTLPELGYAYDALEPVIDAQTMELHHSRHHQTFVDNLNDAVENGVIPADIEIEEILASASTYPNQVRNSAGGHWNHTFFWEIMAPEGERGEMSDALSEAITAVYGSEEEFRTAFNDAGAARFGSGWVWLIVNDANQLEITTTPNQDNPLMDAAEVQGTPIIGNDVWEHAYYLNYQNRRAEYLQNWWDVVNWDEVSARYEAALAE